MKGCSVRSRSVMRGRAASGWRLCMAITPGTRRNSECSRPATDSSSAIRPKSSCPAVTCCSTSRELMIWNDIWMRRSCRPNAAIARGMKPVPSAGSDPTARRPTPNDLRLRMRCSISSKPAKQRSTSSISAPASWVGTSRPRTRSNSRNSDEVSSLRMAWLTAGCEMPSRVAALLVVPACITARKTWISRMSIYKSRLLTKFLRLLRQW